jgi:cell division protein FtsQ
MRPRANKRRPESLWTRLPKPAVVAEACGRTLRRSLPLVVGAGVLFAVGGTAWAGYRFVTTSPRFAITRLEVTGNQHLTRDDVLAGVAARIGDNVFATKLDDLVTELRKNPWIARAEAHRELPHTIVISVREHVPAVIVELGGLYLADAEGHVFKRLELGASPEAAGLTDEGAGLPIITGLDRTSYVADPNGTAAQIRASLATLTRWRAEQDRPSIGEVHLGSHGALTLVTYEHAISIQLGNPDDSLGLRMQTFDATWAELSPTERSRTRAIHLDARPDHVTVALHPSALPTSI